MKTLVTYLEEVFYICGLPIGQLASMYPSINYITEKLGILRSSFLWKSIMDEIDSIIEDTKKTYEAGNPRFKIQYQKL